MMAVKASCQLGVIKGIIRGPIQELPQLHGIQLLIIVGQEIVGCKLVAVIGAALQPAVLEDARRDGGGRALPATCRQQGLAS